MPWFETKDRTVHSPVNPVLEPMFQFLEQYQKTFSGSNFFDELIDNYEYLDQVLNWGQNFAVSDDKNNVENLKEEK